MISLGVLVSGGGTNLQAILDAVAERRIDASVSVVVSNKSNAGALDRARRAGVPTEVVSHRDFATRDLFDAELVERLRAYGVELVVLAGFMRIVTPVLLEAFPHRVINVHPALLPAFPGIDAQAQAHAYGVKVAGCTVHFVDAGTDSGPIIMQEAVIVRDDDRVDDLRARILEVEHRLLPLAIDAIARGAVRVEGRRVFVDRARSTRDS